MALRGNLRSVAAGLGLVLLAACAEPPPPVPPTVVDLGVAAAPGVNPEPGGRPSPVEVRVYQLASADTFQQADFFQLYEQDAATLGADLVDRQDLTLAPGDSRELRLELPDNARFVGVLAAYRDIDRASWRAVAPVPAHATTALTLDVQPLAVTLR